MKALVKNNSVLLYGLMYLAVIVLTFVVTSLFGIL